MRYLIRLSKLIDALSDRLGWLANWMVLAACLISAASAMSRYAVLRHPKVGRSSRIFRADSRPPAWPRSSAC